MDKETIIAMRVAFACAALQGLIAAGGRQGVVSHVDLAFVYADEMMKRLQESF